jgi:hypothetical protein
LSCVERLTVRAALTGAVRRGQRFPADCAVLFPRRNEFVANLRLISR